MGFLDDLREKATDLAQSGVATSKRLAEIAKLKTSNMAEEDTIKRAYTELGKLYYAEHGMTPTGAYVAACEKITTAKQAIDSNNARIAQLKSDAEADGEVVAEVAPSTIENVDSSSHEDVAETPKAEDTGVSE